MMADHMIEEGTILRVTMEVRLPVAATADEISRWLDFNLGHTGSLSGDNPLASKEPEAWGNLGVEWEDTGVTGREDRFNHVDHGGGRSTCNYRFVRTRKAPVVPALPPAGGR